MACFIRYFFPALFLLALNLSYPDSLRAQPEAKELLTQMDQILRGNSHVMTVEMQVHNPRWDRQYKIRVWMKGVDFAFARVLEPSKVEGQGFLRLETRLWNFLPNAERTMLIPPSLMLDRFLGSDFTNDDFVKLTYFPRDYDSKIIEETELEGTPVYHLELIPRPDAPVTYGKLEIWLRQSDSAPARWNFYDGKMKLIRTLDYSEYQIYGTHTVPSVWSMKNLEKEGQHTTLRILDATYDTEVADSIFTKENLENFQ